jgi:hypothetical protein
MVLGGVASTSSFLGWPPAIDTDTEVCVLSLALEFLRGSGFACAAARERVDRLSGAFIPSSDPSTSAPSAPPLPGEPPSEGGTAGARLARVRFAGYVASPSSASRRRRRGLLCPPLRRLRGLGLSGAAGGSAATARGVAASMLSVSPASRGLAADRREREALRAASSAWPCECTPRSSWGRESANRPSG